MTKLWIDRTAQIFLLCATALLLAGTLFGFYRLLHEGSFSELIVIGIACLLYYCTHSHYLPLRVDSDGLPLASPRFPSMGRKKLRFAGIKEIQLENCRYWDERDNPMQRWQGMFMVRVTDAQGRSCRNVIFRDAISGFKATIADKIDRQALRGKLK